jgi:AAA domain-containing protein/bifunctional DNA primase/polymerase-like protein
VGIRTGAGSDLLVIDVDPRNGGSLDAVYARFPELRDARLAQSGGGGWHIHLRYPGFEVESGQNVLGPGIDVKCDKGYIVAHPSRLKSGGRYCWQNGFETPLVECPPALIVALQAYMATRAAGATTSADLLGKTTSSSVNRYSKNAAKLLADALAKTGDGSGDTVGYELARKLLASGCGDIEAQDALMAYGRAATVDAGDPFTERDVSRWLSSARSSNHVRNAATSADPLGETTGSSVTHTSDVHDRSFPLMGEDGHDHAHDDVSVTSELLRRDSGGRFPLLGLDDLARVGLAKPEELIPGKMMKRSLTITYGDGETGKSYYAQDACFTLAASGVPVWYVAAEGFDGIYLRILAWLATHPGQSLDALRIIPLPVQIFKGDDRRIVAAQARELPLEQRPALITLDTLHRCVVGARENDNSDMVCVANTASHWRSELGATTWVIHHEGKNAGPGMRGASCLYDDADSVQYVFRGGDISVIECEKQKDAIPRFEPEAYTLESHALDEWGYPGLSANVLKPLSSDNILEARRLWRADQQRRQPGAKNAAGDDDGSALSDTLKQGLEVFEGLLKGYPAGVFKAAWRKQCEEVGIKSGSFDWMTKELVRRGKVSAPTDTTGRYTATSSTSSTEEGAA